jgi:hypothetical protein
MVESDDRRAARELAAHALDRVGRVAGREPWRAALRWLTGSRLGRRAGWPVVPVTGTPWQDTISPERPGWRQRAAYLHDRGEDEDERLVFAVDYRVCRRCLLGWVEHPYTVPRYEQCGVASAGLAALRVEHPGVKWHTLGGHFPSSQPFWASVGAGVPGGHQQRSLCRHVAR